MTRQSAVRSAKVIQVIHTTSCRGIGSQDDPFREIDEYWSLEGRLLAERDPCQWAIRPPEVIPS